MKLTVLQENLLKVVTAVGRVAQTNGKMPILSHLLLTAKKEGVFVTATDLETAVTVKVGAKVESEGKIAVPARIFGELVGTLPPGKVEVWVEKGTLFVVGGTQKAKLQTMPGEEFPAVPTSISKPLFSASLGLVEAIGRVALAAASDESRPVLTGIQILKENKKARLVATDGYRLSLAWVKIEESNNKQPIRQTQGEQTTSKSEKWTKIVPARAMTEVLHMARSFKSGGDLMIGTTEDENQLVMTNGEVAVAARVLAGEFPAFEQIIPQKGETVATVGFDELLGAVKAAAIFARESANIVKLNLDKKGITVSANSPQVGENETLIEAQIEGPGGNIAFNSRYLIEFLSVVKDIREGKAKKQEEISFEMSGALSPGLFKIKGEEDFIHVIMPVRVQESA